MNPASKIIISPQLKKAFSRGWADHQVFFFSAPCGYGKTTTAKALLAPYKVCQLDPLEIDNPQDKIGDTVSVVLVDDIHTIKKTEAQKQLAELISERADLHFVFLGRGSLPGWLMPFSFAGLLFSIDESMLRFDQFTCQKMIEKQGLSLSPSQFSEIHQLINGYPAGMNILCRKIAQKKAYSPQMLDEGILELFAYFEEAIYLRLEAPLRNLLVCLAPFESFTLELAKMVSGDSRAGELIGSLQKETRMFELEGLDRYVFVPFFQKFLRWQMEKKVSDGEEKMLYNRAALYYEIQGQLDKALDYYSLAGERKKIRDLLIRKAEDHPGLGHYDQLRDHYFSLSRQEVLGSISLMAVMSMISALCLDFEASEDWYQELIDRASGLKKKDDQYRQILGKILYLDIALPQRGVKDLAKIMTNVIKLSKKGPLDLPAFSVTSTLPSVMNGGKDFSVWSKRDDFLYKTMKKPLDFVLGKDAIGLAECGLYESKFEKGQDISRGLLTLMAGLSEIQIKGTLDIEFAIVGLLVRVQLSQGKPEAAMEYLMSFRRRILELGETRFMANIEAMVCRIHMRQGETSAVQAWMKEKAPAKDVRLWVLWRYQYMTAAMGYILEGKYEDTLLITAQLLPYCQRCQRIIDAVHLGLIRALAYWGLKEAAWQAELSSALEVAYEYKFIRPLSQYGVAVLPLLLKSDWATGQASQAYLDEVVEAARQQAVYYPHFLKAKGELSESLSKAEMRVFRLLCQGLSNQGISDILGIRLSTVKTHVSRVLAKLGVKSRTQVREVAEDLGLLTE